MESPRSPRSPSPSDKHTLLNEKITPKQRLRLNISLWPVLGSICFIALLINIAVFKHNRHPPESPHLTWADRASWLSLPDRIEKFEKPKDFRIVALVFYGRRDRVSILDCYLKRNLVHSGGFLDEVIFIQRTHDKEDITWLHRTVSLTPGYTIANRTFPHTSDYSHAWDLCEPNTMYIKLDDDVVYFKDTTIPAIVRTKLTHPHAFLVSANAINQPALAWIHQHIDVVKPYLPELTPIAAPQPRPKYDWRASDLPNWEGHPSYTVPGDFKPPFRKHRWLPAPHLNNTDATPITAATYTQDGPGWHSWTVGAQQQYSFLEHLEKGELWRYKFPIWDYHYARLSITFMAIWGDDVIAVRDQMRGDDEGYLSVDAPRKLGRHAIMDGSGLAAHYSFDAQKPGMENTDLLDRYRAYAEENICKR